MKGLLLKDWYMIKKHCRLYLLLAAVFLVISWFDNASLFYVIYPCLTCGMITVSLMGFDERSGWVRYSGALPYTKAQLVSAKFIVGLLATAAAAAAEGAVQFAKMKVEGTRLIWGLCLPLCLRFLLFQTLRAFCACRLSSVTARKRAESFISQCLLCLPQAAQPSPALLKPAQLCT